MSTSADQPQDIELEAALEAQPQVAGSGSRSHALSDREANALAGSARPTVVVLAGSVASGKTTLITSLYERFSNGPIGQTRFSSSRTLPGFEARAAGLRPVDGVRPQMPHTYRNAVPWLHLRIKDLDVGTPNDLLFGDFDGELFDRVVEGKDPPDLVPGLRRADHLIIVVDGHALISGTEHAFAVQRSRDLITRLTEPNVAASPAVFSLVLTKLDLVNGSKADVRRRARSDLTDLRDYLSARTERPNVPIIETAAISSTPDLPIGHGAEELLDVWRRRPAEIIGGSVWPKPTAASSAFFGEFRG
jgi:hypothetical protein